MAKQLKVTQFTVVPVVPREITSHRGWRAYDDHELLRETIATLKENTRISVFVDATIESVNYAYEAGADAVEFYTGDYAFYYGANKGYYYLNQLIKASDFAREKGLRIHAGHDLNLWHW